MGGLEATVVSDYPHRAAAFIRAGGLDGDGRRVQPQNLVVILARELADKLATAMFVVDHEGRLAYFNERAGEILGTTYASVGRMGMEEWSTAFQPTHKDGQPLGSDQIPLVVALRDRRPDHRSFRITGEDGTERFIAATAFPLFAREDEFVGAAAIFWEQPNVEETG
jgi:PAS domain S-box-containing protein